MRREVGLVEEFEAHAAYFRSRGWEPPEVVIVTWGEWEQVEMEANWVGPIPYLSGQAIALFKKDIPVGCVGKEIATNDAG